MYLKLLASGVGHDSRISGFQRLQNLHGIDPPCPNNTSEGVCFQCSAEICTRERENCYKEEYIKQTPFSKTCLKFGRNGFNGQKANMRKMLTVPGFSHLSSPSPSKIKITD